MARPVSRPSALPKAGPRPLRHRRASVAVGFVVGMLSALEAKGVDPAAVLREAGLSPRLLDDPQGRVPLTDYANLYNHVVTSLDDEGFGLFSVKLRCGTFEFLCRSMVGSRNLGEALVRASGFLRLVLPDLALAIATDSSGAKIEIVETAPLTLNRDDHRRVFAFEWLLRLVHGLACWLVGRGLSLESVQFPYSRPSHAEDYALIYTEHALFAGRSLIARFHPQLLALPIGRDQKAVTDFLEGAPGKIAMLYRRDHEIVRQIRDILATTLPEAPDLAGVAQRLRLSLRTVQRRLKQEGASFRGVKAALRRDLALAGVEDSSRPISAIALELGYAESSAFFRAFVDWTGEAPTSYRKRLRSLTL